VLDPALLAFTDGQQAVVERFRALSTRVYHLRSNSQRPVRKLLVTSAVPGDGKTFVALNFAVSLSAGDQQVLLIEGDLLHPGLSSLFDIKHREGLNELVHSDVSSPLGNISKYLCRLGSHSLWLMPSGTPAKRPLDLLQSRRMEELMNLLAASFDWVVIDSPPVLPFADVDAWARLCDGALMVVRRARTPKPDLQRALSDLNSCPLLGVIYNDSKEPKSSYYEYYRQAS
jgi:capsular exopolysaccharide synthesis family protein